MYTSLSLNLFDGCVWALLFGNPADAGNFSGIAKVLLAGGATLGTVLTMLVTPFFFFHCFLAGRNMTTIEFLARMWPGAGAGEEEVGRGRTRETKYRHDKDFLAAANAKIHEGDRVGIWDKSYG